MLYKLCIIYWNQYRFNIFNYYCCGFLLSWGCVIITVHFQKKQQNNINNNQNYTTFWKDNNQIDVVNCRMICGEYNKKIKDETDFPEYLDMVGQYIYKKHIEYKTEQLNKKYPIRSEFYIFSYDISKVFFP